MAHQVTLSYSIVNVHLFNGCIEVETFSAIISDKEDVTTLSVAECRKHLNGIELSDKQVLELRDSISVLIDSALDNYFNKLIVNYASTNTEK